MATQDVVGSVVDLEATIQRMQAEKDRQHAIDTAEAEAAERLAEAQFAAAFREGQVWAANRASLEQLRTAARMTDRAVLDRLETQASMTGRSIGELISDRIGEKPGEDCRGFLEGAAQIYEQVKARLK